MKQRESQDQEEESVCRPDKMNLQKKLNDGKK
jgi:hypothetical protein